MTKQEVFDKVATHLLTQNKKAICPIDGRCKYRTSEGLKCAAGIMISDDEYSPEMESWAVNHLITKYNLEKIAPFKDLLYKLQGIHDWKEVQNWKTELQKLAVSHNLSTAVLD